jgi:hypothetical protein
MLAQAQERMGAGAPVYRTEWVDHGFVAIVQSDLPLDCHEGCFEALRPAWHQQRACSS